MFVVTSISRAAIMEDFMEIQIYFFCVYVLQKLHY